MFNSQETKTVVEIDDQIFSDAHGVNPPCQENLPFDENCIYEEKVALVCLFVAFSLRLFPRLTVIFFFFPLLVIVSAFPQSLTKHQIDRIPTTSLCHEHTAQQRFHPGKCNNQHKDFCPPYRKKFESKSRVIFSHLELNRVYLQCNVCTAYTCNHAQHVWMLTWTCTTFSACDIKAE